MIKTLTIKFRHLLHNDTKSVLTRLFMNQILQSDDFFIVFAQFSYAYMH